MCDCLCHLQCDNFPWQPFKFHALVRELKTTVDAQPKQAEHNRGNMIIPNLQDVLIYHLVTIQKFCEKMPFFVLLRMSFELYRWAKANWSKMVNFSYHSTCLHRCIGAWHTNFFRIFHDKPIFSIFFVIDEKLLRRQSELPCSRKGIKVNPTSIHRFHIN